MTVRALMRREPQQLQLFATPAKSPARRALSITATGLTVVFVILWVLLLRPPAFGGSALYVRVTGISMQETYHDGDLVITRARPAYELGDVVAYPVPKEAPHGVKPGTLIIHRIVDGNGKKGWVTQGDNRDEIDPWRPTDADIKGAVWFHLPGAVNLATGMLTNPMALSSILGGIVFLFVVIEPKKKTTGRPREEVAA